MPRQHHQPRQPPRQPRQPNQPHRSCQPRLPRIRPVQWHDPMVDMLIKERRRGNDRYHDSYGRSRQDFWMSVARRFICVIFILHIL
jgi:hypothetical protein